MLIDETLRLMNHVVELAAAFHIDVFVGPIEASGAGHCIIECPRCRARNRLTRVGWTRCGRCKADLGQCDKPKCARFAMITNHFTYAVALHELGHCEAPNGMMPRHEFTAHYNATGQFSSIRDIALRMMEERAAWAWARYHALCWNAEMDAAEAVGLRSYDTSVKRIVGRTM